MKKFEVGCLYKIRFEDHAVGIKKVMTCEAVGWIIEDTPRYLILTSWQVIDEADEEIVKNNHEPTTILKSCILKKRKYS